LRAKRATQPTTRRQGRYPLAILHSALAPWHICVVARMDEGHAEAACLQDLGDRNPGHAGQCYRHCLHPAGGPTIHQRIQVWGTWAKRTHRCGVPIIGDIRPRFVTATIQAKGVRVHTWARSGTRGREGRVRMGEPPLSGPSLRCIGTFGPGPLYWRRFPSEKAQNT
jgi:hypothetical protein